MAGLHNRHLSHSSEGSKFKSWQIWFPERALFQAATDCCVLTWPLFRVNMSLCILLDGPWCYPEGLTLTAHLYRPSHWTLGLQHVCFRSTHRFSPWQSQSFMLFFVFASANKDFSYYILCSIRFFPQIWFLKSQHFVICTKVKYRQCLHFSMIWDGCY